MIITSLLDNDLYKFTMQNAVMHYFPDVHVKYEFINRGNHVFNKDFLDKLVKELSDLSSLRFTSDELHWLKAKCPVLSSKYIDWLSNFKFNYSDVKITENDGLTIRGKWLDTILWEVPLMATISELYFKDLYHTTHDQLCKDIQDKADILKDSNVKYIDFGTRRRRSFNNQNAVCSRLSDSFNCKGFLGTSNVYFARKFELKPIGTMAHEWIMAISALDNLRFANKRALQLWSDLYRGELGIALTDTFGTDAFLKDFDGYYARLYDGVRQDSGSPFLIANKIIQHYKNLHISPQTKTIVFSDSLNPQLAAELTEEFADKINVICGIGTNFTNDARNPLNIVIKMTECNGIKVVKLSDSPTKITGDAKTVELYKSVFGS